MLNGLLESIINVCSNLPVVRNDKRYISKIMVISQVSETLTDMGGA